MPTVTVRPVGVEVAAGPRLWVGALSRMGTSACGSGRVFGSCDPFWSAPVNARPFVPRVRPVDGRSVISRCSLLYGCTPTRAAPGLNLSRPDSVSTSRIGPLTSLRGPVAWLFSRAARCPGSPIAFELDLRPMGEACSRQRRGPVWSSTPTILDSLPDSGQAFSATGSSRTPLGASRVERIGAPNQPGHWIWADPEGNRFRAPGQWGPEQRRR